MFLEIKAISFRNQANGTSGALAIRKNAFEQVLTPEWQNGITRNAEDSVAAFTMNQGQTSPLKVQVDLQVSGLGKPSSIFVRAVHPEMPLSPSFWETLLHTQVNVLGEVKERQIILNGNGETGFQTFELQNYRLDRKGVGIYRNTWRWQYRAPESNFWVDFGLTKHQIYLLLNIPTDPWIQSDFNDPLVPWKDVLDHACQWASGAKTEDEAATLITQRLYFLAPRLFQYNCINFLPAYVQIINFSGETFFNCTSFLEHLRTGNVNRYVICSDCAAIVSTFANILGCDLWQSIMFTLGTIFRVNPVLPIGVQFWNTPCGFPGFAYHEVAWKGNCTANDTIFDACVAIDASANPLDFERTPIIPTNILLGSRGSGLYKDKFVFPPDWDLCQPEPMFRRRRRPVAVPAPQILKAVKKGELSSKPFEISRLQDVKQRYNFENWHNYTNCEELFIKNFFIAPSMFPEWEIQLFNEMESDSNTPGFIHSIWRHPAYPNSAFQVDLYECPSRSAAQEFALHLLGESHVQLPHFMETSHPGDVAFEWSDEKSILFSRANILLMLSNAGKKPVSIIPLANFLDHYLSDRPLLATQEESLLVVEKPKTIKVGRIVTLLTQEKTVIEKSREQTGRTFYKIFTPDGQILYKNKKLSYRPLSKGEQQIAVFAINAEQQAYTQHLEMEAG